MLTHRNRFNWTRLESELLSGAVEILDRKPKARRFSADSKRAARKFLDENRASRRVYVSLDDRIRRAEN